MAEVIDGEPVVSKGRDLWAELLTETHAAATVRLPGNRNLIVFGDQESGKSSLVTSLQAGSDQNGNASNTGLALEYHTVPVADAERDAHTCLGIHVLDGSAGLAPLLKFALDETTLDACVVVIVVSIERPWLMAQSLQRWISLLTRHMERLRLTHPDLVKAAEQRQLDRWHDGEIPYSDDASIEPPSGDADASLDETLTLNLGVPVILVVTKTDMMPTLEKDLNLKQQHWDFLQMHLRRTALSLGAALVYHSGKDQAVCARLRKYILHVTYGFPFSGKPNVIDKDAVFVPSGWDTPRLISALQESFSSINACDAFETVFRRPPGASSGGGPLNFRNEDTVSAEEEQAFLGRIKSQLDKAVGARVPLVSEASANAPSPTQNVTQTAASTGSAASPIMTRATATSAGGIPAGGTPGSAGPGAAGGRNDSSVLTDFFNNLLQTRKAPGSGPSTPQQKPKNAQGADLDRPTSPIDNDSSTV